MQGHRVMYDGLYTLVLRLANIALAIALGVLTARLLGPSGKGLYAMPGVQAGLVGTAFGGLASATSYYMLNHRAGRAILRPAAMAAVVLVIAAALSVIGLGALGHAFWAVPAAIASLPASAASSLVLGYVTGIKRIRLATTFTVATTLFTLAFMAAGLFLVAHSPAIAIVAWIAGTTVVSLVAVGAMCVHAMTLERGAPIAFGAYFRMVLKVGATSIVTLLNYRGDLYIVAAMLPPADLGLYTVAISAAESLLIPTQAAALVTSPHVGGLERSAAATLTARCVRNNLLCAGALCVVVFAGAPLIVRVLYGSSFLVPALRVLLLGVVALSLGSPISSYYTLKLGKPEIPLALAATSAIICIAGAVVLVPHFGIVGAAISSSAAYILGQGIGISYFSRRAHVSARAILLPTRDDLRTYRSFALRVYRDGLGLLTPRFDPNT
jgi:O-antigen/teichoic acid export membrane protein